MENHEQKLFTAEVLNVMANGLMSRLQTFSHWLIVGFGASIALLVANVNDVAEHIEPSVISTVVRIFLAAAIFNITQRFMYAIRSSSMAVYDRTVDLAKSHNIKEKGMDFDIYTNDIVNSAIGPFRWYLRWRFKKQIPSPFSLAILAARSAQFQGILVLAQLICFFWAGYTIASALS